MKTLLLTLVSLISFAGNSVLCRLALKDGAIDELSFTALRLFSGAVVLAALWLGLSRKKPQKLPGSNASAIMLFIYALCFSLAYLYLNTGTGALILFAAVQITMVGVSIAKGEVLTWPEWLGLCVAFAGFVYLVLPGAESPSLSGFILMTLSGVAWGYYSLHGRSSLTPLMDTAGNFIRTLPLALVLGVLMLWRAELSWVGVALALASGAITSGLGYAIWYSALAGLTSTQAAVVQLFVPVIAAWGGVWFAGEALSLRLVIAALLVLGGIAILVFGKSYFRQKSAP